MASRKKKDYTKVLSITECNICHLELSDPRRIECDHVFCLHCLNQHISCSSSCPTCKRPMKPKLGKVEHYPVAMEIVHLLQSLQKVAGCSNIADAESSTREEEKDEPDEDQYVVVDTVDEVKTKTQPKSVTSNEVCDIHGQRLVSVCTTCDDELICSKCSMHSNHNKLEISEYNRNLEQLLKKQRADLLRRETGDGEEEEKLQETIEKHVEQRETIKDEIEEMLRPVEKKADKYVKQLTERQEDIKDRISEFSHISNRTGNLSHDDTTDYSRKAKRLAKQLGIALKIENKPAPRYENIEFIRSHISLPFKTDDEKTSHDLCVSLYDETIPKQLYNQEPFEHNQYKPANHHVFLPNKSKGNNKIYDDQNESPFDETIPEQIHNTEPFGHKENRLASHQLFLPSKTDKKIYDDLNDSLYDETIPKQIHNTEPVGHTEEKPVNQQMSLAPRFENKIYDDLNDSQYEETIPKQIHNTEPVVGHTEEKPDSHFNSPS